MKLSDYHLNIPQLANTPLIGKFFKPPEPISPLGPKKEYPPMIFKNGGNMTTTQAPQVSEISQPSPRVENSQAIATPMTPPMTRPQLKVPAGLYDAAQEIGKVYGIDPKNFIANSKWEHRGTKAWEQGKFNSNVWWDQNRNTGEESYGPYQINMRYFGPKAVELGRITPDHPLYVTPEQAMDPYESTKWQAKKWSREQKAGITDWARLFQLHNSNEEGRAGKVMEIVDNNDFVRGDQ